MNQTAKDMRVDLRLTMSEDVYDPMIMASKIEQIAATKPDAMIVSIPDATIQQAVGAITSAGEIPVFGLNSGVDVARTLGVLGFVAMNDYLGGEAAGDHFQFIFNQSGVNATGRGLFVNLDCKCLCVGDRNL